MKHQRTTKNRPQKTGAAVNPCDWQGCGATGEYRAPKSRDQMTSYLWFCLDHIREYNKSWNYYDGMNDSQVEEDLRHDTVWNRPTWQLGSNAGAFGFGEKADTFDLFGEGTNAPPGNGAGASTLRPPVNKEEERAYRTLGLDYPATSEDVKFRYKALVKEHHPDANRGAPESEERLKEINQAYHVLRDVMTAAG